MVCIFRFNNFHYTAWNDTDLIQVVNFTGLMQVCHQVVWSLLATSSCMKPVGFIKLHHVCWLHQVASSMLASPSCIKPVGFIKLHQACCLHQVASSLWIRLKKTWYLQTCCWHNLLENIMSRESTCIKRVEIAAHLLASSRSKRCQQCHLHVFGYVPLYFPDL